MNSISKNVRKILACSYCGNNLEMIDTGAKCPNCGLSYFSTDSGALDLRLQKQKTYPLEFELGTPLLSEDGFLFDPLEKNPAPEVDFSGLIIPRHLTREIVSYFPKAQSADSLMLDLGCGKGNYREIGEHAGFEWVGLDYDSSGAQILGDAHSLPFEDNSFEFVLCLTVIQFLRFPFVMIREVNRVLKPGGKFIGSISFLEPSYGTSSYHHAHLGTYNLLKFGGFNIEKIAPFENWPALKAQASMGMFHGMPRFLSQAMVYPLQFFHELWWKAGGMLRGKDLTNMRIQNFTGSFSFIASK